MSLKTKELKLNQSEIPLQVPECTILLGYAGSTAHGTYIPNTDPDSIDDVDLLGVCIGTETNYFGLTNFEQHLFKEDV